MFSLSSIESAGGTLHVRVSLHGRKALTFDLPATDLIKSLTGFEKAMAIKTSNRFDPAQHRKVRSNLVLLIEDALDGKVAGVDHLLPAVAAHGTVWCLVNHYRDADGTRRSIHRFLDERKLACLDLVTTANDQMAFTVSAEPAGGRIAELVKDTRHGTTIGIVAGEDRESVVTAYEVPTQH